MEQVVGQLDLPPYMLGISWSTTERMSKDQNDMIVSNINWERNKLDSVLRQIHDYFLIWEGFKGAKYDILWDEVNLLDETSQAQARLWNAQAAEKIILNVATMIQYGWLDDKKGEDYLRAEGINIKNMPKNWHATTKGIQYVQQVARQLLSGV